MARTYVGILLGLVLAGILAAQDRLVVVGGSRSHPRPSPSGFGNILYPGTGAPPPIPNPFHRQPTSFAQRLGATVSGYPGYMYRPPSRGQTGGIWPVLIPYAVPMYTGGYGYVPAPPAATNVTVVSPPAPSPQVIINQYYTPDTARPLIRDYTQTPLPEPGSADLRSYQAPIPSHPEPERPAERGPAESKATIYLIAFKDHSIQAAYAYWVKDETLHYITVQGSHNKASLELVDREFSERLNRERNVEFDLGKAK